MAGKKQRDYLDTHKRIRAKLLETINRTEAGCIDVVKLARELGMDIRTVRAHLEIMEVDSAGVFMDATKKQFCTKEGIALLANTLKLSGNNTG